PIAVGGALIRTLVPIGTHFSAHFELHQGLAENRDGFSKKVGIMHSVLAQKLFKCDAKIGHFRVLLCDVLVLQRLEPESDLFCQDHPLFTPLLGTLTSRDQSLPCFDLHETRAKGVRGAGVGSFRREVGLVMDRYDLSIVIPAYNEE